MLLNLVRHIKKLTSQIIKNYYLTYIWQNRRGFSLYSVLFAVGIFATLTTLWVSCLALTIKAWFSIHNEVSLCDVGKYMQGVIEKDVGYESTKVTIRKDTKGKQQLECQNIYGNKTITFFIEDVRLLKKVKTENGTGNNALYINGYDVENWQVRKIDQKNIRVNFELAKNGRKKIFTQIVHCYNGEVIDNG